MSEGWIKLHRQILNSRVFANEGLLRLWIYCLCRANHEINFVPINTGRGETEIQVKPGQFVFGRMSVSKDLNMNPNTLYKRMQKLKDLGNINIESNTHYSVVSICNWKVYQKTKKEEEHAKEQPSNNQVTAKEQPSNTEKNDKNDKKYIPTLDEVKKYFINNGYNPKVAEKAFNIYNASLEDHPRRKYWRDSRDNIIKNWKLKMQSVWFKDENKASTNTRKHQIV